MVNLATKFSTKGPVWRPQFCARFHVRTNGTVWRPENERQVSENEIQNFENLSRYSRSVNLAHSHTEHVLEHVICKDMQLAVEERPMSLRSLGMEKAMTSEIVQIEPW